MNKILSLTMLAAGLALPMLSGAVTKVYTLNLGSTQEVPANLSPAAGSAQITVDDTADTISFVLTAFTLQGVFANAHIHGQAMPGSNAGVVFGLLANADAMGQAMVGSFAIPNSYALVGSNKASTFADAINAAPWMYYVNLHTTAFPGGEIRGQLAPVPEPSTYAMLLGGLAVVGWLASRRRRPD
jgi:hypothetical protein